MTFFLNFPTLCARARLLTVQCLCTTYSWQGLDHPSPHWSLIFFILNVIFVFSFKLNYDVHVQEKSKHKHICAMMRSLATCNRAMHESCAATTCWRHFIMSHFVEGYSSVIIGTCRISGKDRTRGHLRAMTSYFASDAWLHQPWHDVIDCKHFMCAYN